jgi:hypothetical protein
MPLLLIGGCDRTTAKNEDFILTLYAEYESGGQFDCYAALQYTGGESSVTVYSGDPAVVFSLKNSDGESIGGLQLAVLAPYAFAKNEIKKYPYIKTGGFDKDTQQWIKDYLNNDELTLPKGTYTITATFEYTLDPRPGVDNYKTLEVTKTFKVS